MWSPGEPGTARAREGAELGGAGVAGGAAAPCWLLGTLPASWGRVCCRVRCFKCGELSCERCSSGTAAASNWVRKVVQKGLIRFGDTKYGADTKYDCDYYLALEESFP